MKENNYDKLIKLLDEINECLNEREKEGEHLKSRIFETYHLLQYFLGV